MHNPPNTGFPTDWQTAPAAEPGAVRQRANRHGSLQRGVAAIWLNHPDEGNTMSSNPPEHAEKKREIRQRSSRKIVGLLMLMFGVPPLLNALGNPRIQTLHAPDVLGLIASGLCFGFGLGCS